MRLLDYLDIGARGWVARGCVERQLASHSHGFVWMRDSAPAIREAIVHPFVVRIRSSTHASGSVRARARTERGRGGGRRRGGGGICVRLHARPRSSVCVRVRL